MKKLIFLTVVILLFSIELSAQSKKKVSGKPTTFMNPILAGDHADPSILRDGKDYYMVHSSFEYYPGLLIWHSTDLINWEPVTHALITNLGSVWAPDLAKYKDKFTSIFRPTAKTMWFGPMQLTARGANPST
jgi:beta-xylosidase